MDSGSKARMIRLWRTGSLGRGREWRKGDGERVRMRFASAPSAARNGAWEIICGLAQASASTPVKAEREIICGLAQASASTPVKAEREIICGLAQASASTPRRAEREIIRDKTRASTVVGQARWGCEPWVIIRGEGTRASAAKTLARWLGRPREIICGRSLQASAVKVGARLGAGPRASGARRRRGKGGREGALVFRVILSGFMVLPGTRGWSRGEEELRTVGGSVPFRPVSTGCMTHGTPNDSSPVWPDMWNRGRVEYSIYVLLVSRGVVSHSLGTPATPEIIGSRPPALFYGFIGNVAMQLCQ